jgi:hypothetical protein
MDERKNATSHSIPASIEWVESSGPVSPRFQHVIHLLVKAERGEVHITYERQDATGTTTRTGTMESESHEALWRDLLAILPLDTHLDLSGALRDRKGISYNHVALSLGDANSRLDYVLSQLDETNGDPRVRCVVGAINSAVLDALGPLPATP